MAPTDYAGLQYRNAQRHDTDESSPSSTQAHPGRAARAGRMGRMGRMASAPRPPSQGRGGRSPAVVTNGEDAVLTHLSRLPLFQELDPAQLARIAPYARCSRLEKGAILFHKGDTAHGIHLVIRGQVKLAFPSVQGNEKVVAIIGRGQSFGEAAMFLERPYPVSAEALTAVELLFVPDALVLRLLADDPTFGRRLLAGLAERLHTLVQDVEIYSQRSSTQRVIGYLLQLCGDEEVNASVPWVDLPTSKQIIASRLNLTPETFSRILHDLAERGLIGVRGRRILIPDTAALRRHEL